MTPQEFKRLLDKYASGNCSPEEVQIIDQWYDHIKGVEKDDNLFSNRFETELWSAIRPSTPIRSDFRLIYKIAATIGLVGLAFIGLFRYSSHQSAVEEVTTQVSENSEKSSSIHFSNTEKFSQKLTLADGSTVVLAPGSAISYPPMFESDKRVVQLSGEGFFDVKRDASKPFYVYSKEIITKVLGTSFNIKAYDTEKEIIVAVKTGRVSVYENPVKQSRRRASLQDVILTPNQQVVYHREAQMVSKQIVSSPAVIMKNSDLFKMQFDGKPVTEIFEVLEQNYGIKIEYDQEILNGCVLTTSMAEEGFYERINVICKAINAEFSTTDGVITIKSEGCK